MEEKTSPKNTIRIIAVISLAISIIGVYLLLTIKDPKKPLAGQGTMNEQVSIGGDFSLINQEGQTFTNAQLKGKPSLIYFGFTFCPDICPTTLQKITEVMNILDKYHFDVTPVFITIDPTRDTAKALKEYLSHFHPKIIGLTGTEEQIKQVADKYKIYFAKVEGSGTGRNDYLVDHSSFIYLFDKNNNYLKHFYTTSTPEEIVEYIRINTR